MRKEKSKLAQNHATNGHPTPMKLLLRATLTTLLAVATATATVLLGAPAWVTVGLVILITGLQQWFSAHGVTQSALEREASSEKFERVFHASPNWIVITRLADGVVIDANEGFERISGYTRLEVIGKPIGQFNIWVVPEQRSQIVEALMRDGNVRNASAQIRRRDGEVRDFIVNSSLVSLDGKDHSHAVWIARDVTEEQAAHEQFVAAFRLTPDFMSISSAKDGRYVEVNQAFERFTGRKREDVIGRTSTEIGLWHDTAERAAMMQRIERDKEVREFEVHLRNHAGVVREGLGYASVFESRGERYLIAAMRDVTEERQTQQRIEALVQERTAQLQAANDELSQALKTIELARDSLVQSEKLASLGALVAGIAHELNTPIGNGLMVASTLDEKAQEFALAAKQPMQRSALDRFVSETQNAAELLVRSLGRSAALVSSFKQVAVDQTSSQRRTFDLRGLVDEAVLTISPATHRAHCTVLLNIEPQLTFDSHPGPLVQVLTNLINNALVHAFEGQQTPRVVISANRCDRDAGLVNLRINDNGCGISPAHIKRIFDPFFTTRLGQGGSGLGLHIVHNIVTSVLGGRIEVHTVLGAGTTFEMELPLLAPQTDT
jgi:PAS domain S-box-containing protein